MSDEDFIYVCRPKLPEADEIAGYLRMIDARRLYTNRGPLVNRLEERLALEMDAPRHGVHTASSGTSAIEVAILAHAGLATPERPLALLPSFTFAATGLAVERCGYRAHFVDIDPETWAVDPAALARHPRLAEAGLIVAVAPYGILPDMAGFEALQRDTGVPVVIDAAAAFEQVVTRPAPLSETVPITLSFHATKTFSTGEGGAVIWGDRTGQDRVTQVSNFGFFLSRECKVAGTNAKMSEYHAAIGLAMLDAFDTRKRDYAAVTRTYEEAARGLDLGGRLHLPGRVSSAYALFEAETAEGFLTAEAHLLERHVETRRWYEAGQHAQPHFSTAPADPLPVTESLGRRLLGLPMGHDLSTADVTHIVDCLAEAAALTRPAAMMQG